MSKVIYKCADCGSYEIIEGSEEDCEETYKDEEEEIPALEKGEKKSLVSPYYACGEPKNHNHKECPLNRDYHCDERCMWYFEEEEACGLIWNIGKIGRVIKND